MAISIFTVKVVCLEHIDTFKYGNYIDAKNQAFWWYHSGRASEISIIDSSGRLLCTYQREIVFSREFIDVSG